MLLIPDDKAAVVAKALKTAFGVDDPEDVQQLTKGLSSALIYRVLVGGRPYLLRVITRTDAMGDPAFYYRCMEVAAENGVAPGVRYMSVEDRVSITDFIEARPFSLAVARGLMPAALREMHALPKFPVRMNYFERMGGLVERLRTSSLVPEDEFRSDLEVYEGIMRVYPYLDQADWVSAHNDSKPENIVFDGSKPWFVDWEAAFLNDRYLDLAIVGNFIVTDDRGESPYLEEYFGKAIGEYEQARYVLMQEILHFYYFSFLTLFNLKDAEPAAMRSGSNDFRSFHDAMWDGRIELTTAETRINMPDFTWTASGPRRTGQGWLMRRRSLRATMQGESCKVFGSYPAGVGP